MILDSSAVIAIVVAEPGYESLLDRLCEEALLGIGAPTLVEIAIVLVAKMGVPGRSLLSRFIEANDLHVVPFAAGHWDAAAEAYMRFGKGRHPASLNYGDCMTYATAKLAGRPLLCLGDDFRQTNLELAT